MPHASGPTEHQPQPFPLAPAPSTNDGASPPVHGPGRPPQTPQEVALDRLVEAAGPFAKMFFDNQARALELQARQQEREMEFDEKLAENEMRRHRINVAAGLLVGIIVFAFAGFLIWRGREAIAMDLLRNLLTLAGVAFGTWGIAITKRRRQEQKED